MQRPPTTSPSAVQVILEKLRKPHYAIPAAIVVVMLGLAIGVQPRHPASGAEDDFVFMDEPIATPTQPVPTAEPTLEPTAIVTQTVPAADATSHNEVAGAQATPTSEPTVAPTVDPALLAQPTQCGSLQETAVSLGVEQVISGISVQATAASVYPIEYFRCILMATGGTEAYTLAGTIAKAEQDGMTHIVLVDLWVANSSKQFAQVNLKTVQLAAVGQTFAPLATLGGRSEVVVATGQGRAITVVTAIKNTVTPTTGPMTIVVDGPLSNGAQVPGKYQLFLPVP